MSHDSFDKKRIERNVEIPSVVHKNRKFRFSFHLFVRRATPNSVLRRSGTLPSLNLILSHRNEKSPFPQPNCIQLRHISPTINSSHRATVLLASRQDD